MLKRALAAAVAGALGAVTMIGAAAPSGAAVPAGPFVQDAELVAGGAVGGAWQGHSVALSNDGNTAQIVALRGGTVLIGAPFDEATLDVASGATYVFGP